VGMLHFPLNFDFVSNLVDRLVFFYEPFLDLFSC
jgi:hypothetical protein